MKYLLGLFMVFLAATAALADGADVLKVHPKYEGNGFWRFDVKVRHADEGWEHYADRWEVLSPEGRVLGARVLLHPHVYEQPFTRSLGGVFIPEDISEVILKASCSVDGYTGTEMTVTLAR
jgi:hypothetical protein